MKTITIEEFQDQIEDIMEEFDGGSDQHYKIVWEDDGVEKAVMCIPFDGPWETTVKEDEEGELLVELPNRLLAKLGVSEGDDLDMEVVDGAIHLTKKDGKE
jgi:hypothetical protein